MTKMEPTPPMQFKNQAKNNHFFFWCECKKLQTQPLFKKT